MEYIFLESISLYFIFFLINYKWPALIINRLVEGDLIKQSLQCSFCYGFFGAVGLYFWGIADLLDIVCIPVILLFADLLFKKLA